MDSEILTNAAKRGLISTLPPYMVGEDSGVSNTKGLSSWLRAKSTGPFTRYFELLSVKL